jgi:hypothetical protein
MPSQDLPPVGNSNPLRVPPPGFVPRPTSKHTTKANFNTPKQKEARFQHGGAETEAEAFGYDLDIQFPDLDTSVNRFVEEQNTFDVFKRGEMDQFGPRRPRIKGYDPTKPIGAQYANNSPMPIDFQGNRRGGVYASGEPVNTEYVDFTSDEDLVQDPTTSTNVNRPRTVAAAYSPEEEKLSVVFRDNTYYNYYEVTPNEWEKFKKEYSKGQYILEHLNSKPRGAATMGDVPEELLKYAYLSSRVNQVGKLTKSHGHNNQYRPGQALNLPKIRKINDFRGYKPIKLVKVRGIHVKKAASAPTAPTSRTANAAAKRRNGMRALGGK